MRKKRVKLIPFPVIVAAVAGEIDAIHIVLRHYTKYILTLSKKYQGEDEQLHSMGGVSVVYATKMVAVSQSYDGN